MTDEIIKQAAQAETSDDAEDVLGFGDALPVILDDYLSDIWRNVAKSCREQALKDWLRLVERSKTE